MSETKERNFLWRLWAGFWNGLTAFRMAVFNVLFLLLLALILRGLISGDRIVVEEGTTLVIAPVGLIVEEYTGTPAERLLNEALGQQAAETRLRDLLRALELAAEDRHIVQVLLRTDELLGIAPGTLTELDAAFKRFAESGKPVIAYGGSMSQPQFALASMADEIWLDPDGLVLLEGLSYFRNYFAEALERLRVDVNLFRVGEFKSAMEPFIRNDMSEADRAAAEYWIGGLWQGYLEMIAANRGLPIERLIEQTQDPVGLIRAADGDVAAAVLEGGWVDRLVTRPELRLALAERGAPDDDTGFRQISMDDYLAVPRPPKSVGGGRVGIVVASGAIVEGSSSPGMIGSDSTARLLRQAAQDDDIKAVVFRIDSGGGSAFASEIIRQEMLALREAGKPVIVSMGDVAASGGYWIAMGADEIWAYPNTITGSIGIFGFFPTFQRTLEWAGIRTDGFGTTPIAGAFRPDRALPQAAGEILQTVIEQGYREFIGLVARHRDMTIEQVDAVAQGRVWTGQQARDRGLVDQLGTLHDAVEAAARRAGLAEGYKTVYIEPNMSPFAEFLARLGAEALARAGLQLPRNPLAQLIGNDLYRRLSTEFSQIVAARGQRSGLPEIMAHCLCAAPTH